MRRTEQPWTQAELACLAYLHHFGDLRYRKNFPRVVLCRVQDGRFVHREAPAGFIQHLPEPVARAFGRYLSNSDPLTVGYESVKNMQQLRALPRPVQWLAYKASGWIMRALMPDSSMLEDALSDDPNNPGRNFGRFREMLQSPVYQDSFWTDRIVSCPTCSRRNLSKQAFDIEMFMSHREPGLKQVSPAQMQEVLRSRQWRCKECSHSFAIVEEERPQLRWWPVRGGRPTGPGGVFVERLPVYSLSDPVEPGR